MPPVGNDDPTWPGYTPPQPQPSPVRPPVVRQMPMYRAPRNSFLSVSRVTRSAAQLIALALTIIEALLLVRIVLLLLAANPDAPFSSFIYGLTAPLVAPFQGVFPDAVSGLGFTVDVAAILAMIVYAILARLVEAVVGLLARL
jgi:uncharacterized protein YggT (Ycf19 family)